VNSTNGPSPYHDHLIELGKELADRGSQGVMVIDATALAGIETAYGSEAYEEVRQRLYTIFREQQGKDFRSEDLLTLDRPRGLRFILFLGRKRRRNVAATLVDLRAMQARVAAALAPTLGRAAFPYLKTPPRIDVGFGMAVHNPLVHPERIVGTAIRDAIRLASHQREGDYLMVRERLIDLLLRERIITAYQPIMDLRTRTVLGFEALSRGARGTGLEAADALFGAADQHNLLVEVDRLCRRRALLNSGRIPSTAKIFVNTLPATIRDPQFRGKALIDFLDKAQVAPNRIVIEITEKLVIENYTLFREAMAYFTDLGMAFAVDDVGAGYSGLESIASLKPAYLKIDTVLVRDLHASLVNREMVRAIMALGKGIGSTVIAEGIQQQDEVNALQDLGVSWGQGYLLARPDAGPPE
jgi:EAL domain-containing protein (putative c-di-GMP-specific phosphodiesterase class I)